MSDHAIDIEPSADGVFDIELVPPRAAWARAIGTWAIRLVTLGTAPGNPGGRRVLVRTRTTGEQILEVTERFGDEDSDIDAILHDHSWLSARAFALRWLP